MEKLSFFVQMDSYQEKTDAVSTEILSFVFVNILQCTEKWFDHRYESVIVRIMLNVLKSFSIILTNKY